MSETKITFKASTIEKLLKSHWNSKTKINPDASVVAAEYLRLFVTEALERARLESDNPELITPEAIQKILPQLLLDF